MAVAATASTVPLGQQHPHFQSSKSSSSQPRLQEHQPSADTLLGHSQTGTSHQSLPLSAHVQQLPTPRTSTSSGASSPENHSPGTASHAHSHSYSQSSTHSRQAHHNLNQQSPHLCSAHSGLQSTIASTNHTSNGHPANPGLATITKSLNQQSQSPSSYRVSSPGPSSKLGPGLHGPSSSSSPLAGPSTTANSLYNVGGGSSITSVAAGGGASSMTTATSQTSGTFGGRSHTQAQQNHHQYQHQQELLLEDERELQKKNAGPTLPGGGSISAFLPPALNQSLIKAVQSAKDVVNSPSSPHSKMALPYRLPTTSEVGGNCGRSNSAFTPRSTWHPRLNTSSILQAIKLPMICLAWYLSSAVTNNIGKQIMNQFRYPVTLTFVQFWFVSVFCFVAGAGFNMARIRRPTRAIVEMTAPLVGFQVVGHVFSSIAISRVPLSVVHTVKALTPLFTVLFYRVVLGTTYNRAVYLSLVPLTAGVMLACRMSLEFNNLVGLSCALLSTLVFVMQNVFTKKILSSNKGKQPQQDEVGMNGLGNKESISGTMDPIDEALGDNSNNPPQKLDKINILFYSSTLAGVSMIPMWLYVEGSTLMFSEDPLGKASGSGGTWSVISWLLFLNGVSHFFQNFLAFSVLALTSPVTYSIASLIKRIIVIVASIIYFHQTLGATQWTGVGMTFWGLWMYNSAKNAAKVNPASGILANTKVGRRMSRGFGRGLLDSERDGGSNRNNKAGFLV
ncbi:suppressor of loss of ypt1 [Mortierella sp. AM989]|nr:suppressor of loss of ypt1 [Mortierella sp. AM989]